MNRQLQCRQCGKSIERTRPWTAFCSFECRMEWHNTVRSEAVARWHEEQEAQDEQQTIQ
jgi:hypothetical protein